MNDLQKVQFQMFKHIVDVCNGLGLKYFLVCGSALGAEKYGGFIPWDDDLDIGMFRKDYEIFCLKAQELLPDYLFVQNYKTDCYSPIIFTKVRDSRTTYIEKSVAHLEMHHGVFVDIFPLDGYPIDKKGAKILERRKRVFQRKMSCIYDFPNMSFRSKIGKCIRKGLRYHCNTQKRIETFERRISSYKVEDSNLICNHGNWQGQLEYAPKEQYGKGKLATFEGMKVMVPERIDEYLTQKYGDWRVDLPESERRGHHYYEVCDCNRPYTEYIKGNNGKAID